MIFFRGFSGPDSGIMGDLWIPYIQFKYGSEANLSAAWNDYPRVGETWEQIKQPDYAGEYAPLNSPGHQRLYDYQLFREDIAYNWVRRLTAALRRADPNHMLTIGLDQHSAPIKHVDGFEKTYTGFNPQKIAPLLDYSSMHAYNWWDSRVADFIQGVARYCYANKPVVVEEFNLREAGSSITPLLDSTSGWLHWGTFSVPGSSWEDNLFYTNENVTSLGNTFRRIADEVYDSVPTREPDVTGVTVDLKLALTSVDAQNDIYQDYLHTVSSTGGPVGFNVLHYRRPWLLDMPSLNSPEDLLIGQTFRISWQKMTWPVLYDMPVSVRLSRDGGDTWETIADTVVDKNEFVWTVTGPISNSCIMRVVDSLDESVYSNNTIEFTISESDSQVGQVMM